MSAPAKDGSSTRSRGKKRREHPLFSTNAAITSAHQRLRFSHPSPSPPPPSPQPTPFHPPPLPDAQTANQAPTFSTSGCACLDLFFKGVVRGCSQSAMQDMLEKAWAESPELTLQVLLHGRDCREGKGERAVIVAALLWLREHRPCTYIANLLSFLRVGYLKDLLVVAKKAQEDGQDLLGGDGDELVELQVLAEFIRHDVQQLSGLQYSADHLGEGKEGEEGEEKGEGKDEKPSASSPQVSLAAKWAPTEGSHFDEAPLRFAHRLARLLFPNDPRPLWRYRRTLSALRRHLAVVETLACAQQWEWIEFEHVPSKAHMLLKKAFQRHQEGRYAQYLIDVQRGKKSIKSRGLQPHELIRAYRQGGAADATTEAQWAALVKGVSERGWLSGAIAVVDVSGSMSSGAGSVAPIDPALALGILVAEVTTGPFAHRVITFSAKPQWYQLPTGSLFEQVKGLHGADWQQNTNLQAVFDLILSCALKYHVDSSALPSTLFILSDMEFDAGTGGRFKATNFQVVQTKYRLAGYRMPQVVFWNLSGKTSGAPVRMDEKGVALLSGFSAELLKHVIKGNIDNPHALMVEAVSKYAVVVEEHER